MARTGRQHYPGANLERWYEDDYGGSAMESNVVVWHSTEGTSLPSYGGGASAPNFTAVPDFGRERLDWWQHFRFDTSSRALVNRAGGVETNTLNVVQVELVGTCDPRHRSEWNGARAGRDYVLWPDAPAWALAELARFVRWCHDEHGVAMRSPVEWLPYPQSYGDHGARLGGRQWRNTYGHVGHQHVPENDHGDPGQLDMAWVLDMAKNQNYDQEEKDMPTPQECAKAVAEYDGYKVPWPVADGGNDRWQFDNMQESKWRQSWRTEGKVDAIGRDQAALLEEVKRLTEKVDALAVGGVDHDLLARKVADLMSERLAQ